MLQDPGWCSGGIGGIILVSLVQAANTGAPAVAQWGDKAYAMADGVYQMAQQAAHHSASQSNAGNTAGPGGWDPNKFNGVFRDAAERYQYQTSGTLYNQQIQLNITVNGQADTVDVDSIVNGFIHESKFINTSSQWYGTILGKTGISGMEYHVKTWGDLLSREALAAQQHGLQGVKVFTTTEEAVKVATKLYGNQPWFKLIEFIVEAPK